MSGIALLCSACDGLFSGVYDEPARAPEATVSGQLYIDASDWSEWHYIDLKAVADSVTANPDFNPSSAWVSYKIPTEETKGEVTDGSGIYTYWYDVFGAGISNNEFRGKYATAPQPEPGSWTIAVHRNNIRTNGASAASTDFSSIDRVPENIDFLQTLDFREDEWNEKDVWVVQDKMLQGLIGNQGIRVNPVLSQWLTVEIPPVPPAFTLNDKVFIIKCSDGTYGAVQLSDYQSPTGTKCCLTINYKYPLNI